MSLCALVSNCAASKQDGRPEQGATKHLRPCQCSKEKRSDDLGFREGFVEVLEEEGN